MNNWMDTVPSHRRWTRRYPLLLFLMITLCSQMESDWEYTVSSTICRTLCHLLSSTDLYSPALHSITSKPQPCYISLADYLHQRSSILLSCTRVFHQVECYALRLITGIIYILKRNIFLWSNVWNFRYPRLYPLSFCSWIYGVGKDQDMLQTPTEKCKASNVVWKFWRFRREGK